MKYTSTRSCTSSSSSNSGNKDDTEEERLLLVDFETAICQGYASDGGLFVPAPEAESSSSLPMITTEILQHEWAHLSYPELTYRILRLFIDEAEIGNEDLKEICYSSLQAFENPDFAVPVTKLVEGTKGDSSTRTSSSIYVAELYHGPTFCFKDLGMRVLIGLLSFFATRRNRRLTLLVSTTGDTGPAALRAVADANNPLLSLLVHYPKDQISDFQRRQLTTVKSSRVRVVAYEGGGDDMDLPIKRLLASKNDASSSSNSDSIWTGVNSYNIGRPLMQLVHYVWTYLRVIDQESSSSNNKNSKVDYTTKVTFVIPTGAMGNIAGGYLAQQMGLPIARLVAAVNANDATHRVFSTGCLFKMPVVTTLSEAMNVQLPYNLERLLYYGTHQNATLVRQWMSQVEATEKESSFSSDSCTTKNNANSLELTEEWLHKLQQDFGSARATDDQVCRAIVHVKTAFQYYMDPHTAVGWSALEQLGYYQHQTTNTTSTTTATTPATTTTPVALLATASPCKFEHAYTVALGHEGWIEYLQDATAFPAAARKILQGDEEVEPIVYPAQATLEQSQIEWERLARNIILCELEIPST